MKRTILSLIACCGLFNLVSAQRTIEINFSIKDIPMIDRHDIDKIKKGEYYQVEIKNINLNLFKVSLTSKDTVLSKPQQTPTFGNFDLDALSKITAGISPLSTSMTQFSKAFDSVRYSFLFSAQDVKVNNSIIARMGQEKEKLFNARQSIERIQERIDNLKLNVYKLRLNSLKVENPSCTFNFDSALTEIEKIRKDISDLKINITSKKDSYVLFATSNKTAIESYPDLVANDKSIIESYDKLLSTLTDVLSSISADKANELLSSIIFIENNANNTYTSLPFQYNGEQAKVQISVAPRDEKYNLQKYYTQIVFPQIIRNYTVVGASFYLSSLHDRAYSSIKTQLNDSTSIFNFKEENGINSELGITVLLRHGMKFNDKNNFGGHISVGTGISISNKIKPRILFGGGLSFGERHMLAIDFGGIVGYVDRLSNAIDLSKDYPEKPDNITVSKIGIGAFVSIGYVYQF